MGNSKKLVVHSKFLAKRVDHVQVLLFLHLFFIHVEPLNVLSELQGPVDLDLFVS